MVIITNSLGHADFFAQSTPDTGIAIDGKSKWDRLGILNECGGPEVQAAVEFIDGVYRTGQAALTATRAFLGVDESRLALKFYGKMSGNAIKFFDF